MRAATGPFCHDVKLRISDIVAKQRKHEDTEKYNNNVVSRNDNPLTPLLNNLQKDLNQIKIYLKGVGWKTISFERATRNINPRFTEEHLMKIVEEYPEQIRRCRLSEGKYGVKIITDEW